MKDRWLSVDKIAIYLGIKRDAVYKWISERNIFGHKVGHLLKFWKEEIVEWVRSDDSQSNAGEQVRVLPRVFLPASGRFQLTNRCRTAFIGHVISELCYE